MFLKNKKSGLFKNTKNRNTTIFFVGNCEKIYATQFQWSVSAVDLTLAGRKLMVS